MFRAVLEGTWDPRPRASGRQVLAPSTAALEGVSSPWGEVCNPEWDSWWAFRFALPEPLGGLAQDPRVGEAWWELGTVRSRGALGAISQTGGFSRVWVWPSRGHVRVLRGRGPARQGAEGACPRGGRLAGWSSGVLNCCLCAHELACPIHVVVTAGCATEGHPSSTWVGGWADFGAAPSGQDRGEGDSGQLTRHLLSARRCPEGL